MKNITKQDENVAIEIIADYETMPLEGNLIDSGDAEFDKRVCEDVRQQLNVGNVWSWCSVEVKVSYKNIIFSSDYLGCCSYDNEADFKAGAYYSDMVDTCIYDLNKQLQDLCA